MFIQESNLNISRSVRENVTLYRIDSDLGKYIFSVLDFIKPVAYM